jgi:arsenate reductase
MTDDFPITIFHNPECGTSRNTLAMIHAADYQPKVVEYLRTGWTRGQLEELFTAMGVGPKEVLREKGSPAAELGLMRPEVSDDQILDAMVVHPILVNRPIVATPLGTRLCRPSQVVFDLLAHGPDLFTKEDGSVVKLPLDRD